MGGVESIASRYNARLKPTHPRRMHSDVSDCTRTSTGPAHDTHCYPPQREAQYCISRAVAVSPLEVLRYSFFDQILSGRQVPIDALFSGAARGKGRRGW
jgi:hypothetical protein